MPSNIRQFTADLGRFADKVDLDLGQFRRRVTLGLKEKIERRTPVDTGRLRGSWAVSDASPSSFVNPEGNAGIGPVEATFTEPYQSSFVTSNLAYALPIEYGHSQQAPQGMVRISLAEIVTELEAAFGEL
tara:strand:- start:9721 stop:10110 length:390 start_codon:yes stop_codon:yes gene_type:complete